MTKWRSLTAGATLLILFAFLFAGVKDVSADPGGFWYGLYNVQYGPNSPWPDSTWRVMHDRFRMNYALTTINEADEASGTLDSARAAGVGIMQWAVREENTPPDSLVPHPQGGVNRSASSSGLALRRPVRLTFAGALCLCEIAPA